MVLDDTVSLRVARHETPRVERTNRNLSMVPIVLVDVQLNSALGFHIRFLHRPLRSNQKNTF